MLTIMIIIAVIVAAYFLPAIVANNRGHRNAMAIGVLNLLLGWTFVGWAIALVWACTDNVDCPQIDFSPEPPEPSEPKIPDEDVRPALIGGAVIVLAVVGVMAGMYYHNATQPAVQQFDCNPASPNYVGCE